VDINIVLFGGPIDGASITIQLAWLTLGTIHIDECHPSLTNVYGTMTMGTSHPTHNITYSLIDHFHNNEWAMTTIDPSDR
jgi:hypothetical protein